jgi:hypothetical protein
MVYVLRHLNNHADKTVELLDQLEEQMKDMSDVMKDFGKISTPQRDVQD